MRTSDNRNRPIPNSYWVRRGRLAAGEYPGSFERREAANNLSVLFESGIDHFIDLTHPTDGLKPYLQIAEQEASSLGRTVEWERHPIVDLSVPNNPGEMTEILDAIDGALNRRRNVYIHCWGGVGRTGTVVGCWLVRHGYTGDEALDRVAALFDGMEKSHRFESSPETTRQKAFVRHWAEPSRKE